MIKTVLFTLLILFAGCAHKLSAPKTTAADFWHAEEKGDIATAAKLTTKNDPEDAKLHDKIKIEKAYFDEPKIQNGKALVPTTLYLSGFTTMETKQVKVTFNTHLRKKEKEWKVDMFETKKELYLAVGKKYAEQLSKEFAATIRNAFGDGEEIKGIFKELIERLRDSLEHAPKSN